MSEQAAIEIHDSTLEQLESNDEILVLTVSAYVHRSAGQPGIDAGTGWEQTVQVRCRDGRIVRKVDEIPVRLLNGRLTIEGKTFNNVVPLPFEHHGPSTIEFDGPNDQHLVIASAEIEISPIGSARFIEHFRRSA